MNISIGFSAPFTEVLCSEISRVHDVLRVNTRHHIYIYTTQQRSTNLIYVIKRTRTCRYLSSAGLGWVRSELNAPDSNSSVRTQLTYPKLRYYKHSNCMLYLFSYLSSQSLPSLSNAFARKREGVGGRANTAGRGTIH